jgi:hypothetical protein
MAEVRLAVDVINGGGDVKLFVHWNDECDGQRRYWQSCAIGTFRPRRPPRSRIRESRVFEGKNEEENDFAIRQASRLPQGNSVLQFLPAVAENQPTNKNRMTTELSNFAARLRERVLLFTDVAAEVARLKFQEPRIRTPDPNQSEPPHVGCYENEFNVLALELFALQFKSNAACRTICEARNLKPGVVEHWTQIPAVPTAAFKELDLTCLAPDQRTTVFHSSGTTEQRPSRHFHSPESLKLYEALLWPWFEQNISVNLEFRIQNSELLVLTPPPDQAPHSSLVHMFETVRRKLGATDTVFVGRLAADGAWTLDFDRAMAALGNNPPSAIRHPKLILGTAFSFVHLLDYLAERKLQFQLPAGSRVMETGGYKNRSRSLPKTGLHQLISQRLGVPPSQIVCEYGMSELSSQAYDGTIQTNDLNLPHPGPLPKERENRHQSAGESVEFRHSKERTLLFPLLEGEGQGEGKRAVKPHCFCFPPWARVQIISPETGREVADGETGLIRVFDLANVFSVMAIQTEDLGIRRGDGFELVGRAALAEPRGCSLMAHSALRAPHSAIK